MRSRVWKWRLVLPVLAVLAPGGDTASADVRHFFPTAGVSEGCTDPGNPGGVVPVKSLDVFCDHLPAGSFASGFLSSDLRGQARFGMRAFKTMGVVASTAESFFGNGMMEDTLFVDSPTSYIAQFALHVEGKIELEMPLVLPRWAPIDVQFLVVPSNHLNDAPPCQVTEVFGDTEQDAPGGSLVDLYRNGYTFRFRPGNDPPVGFYTQSIIKLNNDIVFTCPGPAGQQPFTYALRVTTGDNGHYDGEFNYHPGFTIAQMSNAIVRNDNSLLTAGPLAATMSVRNLPPGATVSSQSGYFANWNTPVGGPELVPLGTATLTFETVTQDGTTTLATGSDGPAPPPGFKHASVPTYFDLATSALFSGAVTVCIDYGGLTFDDETSLRLFHYAGASWEDHTVSLNTETNKVCARVTSLSPFAVFEAESNQPPVADAGVPQTVNEGAAVSLDGSASSDPEGTALTYTWSQTAGPVVTLDLSDPVRPTFVAPAVAAAGAELTFQLVVSDGKESSAPASVDVTVLNVNHAPTAAGGADQTVPEGAAVLLDGSASSDPDGDALTYGWTQLSGPAVGLAGSGSATASFTAPAVGPGGAILVFQLSVADGLGGGATDQVQVVVQNVNQPPVCAAARPTSSLLRPPNHRLVPIGILDVSDPDGDAITTSITGVTQDEPVSCVSDDDKSPDAVLASDGVVLRAERAGRGNGRVYRIRFTARDAGGGACTGLVTVCVPHDRGGRGTCVDDGGVFDSLQRGPACCDGDRRDGDRHGECEDEDGDHRDDHRHRHDHRH